MQLLAYVTLFFALSLHTAALMRTNKLACWMPETRTIEQYYMQIGLQKKATATEAHVSEKQVDERTIISLYSKVRNVVLKCTLHMVETYACYIS